LNMTSLLSISIFSIILVISHSPLSKCPNGHFPPPLPFPFHAPFMFTCQYVQQIWRRPIYPVSTKTISIIM
jgi:hypothetical protein